MMITFSVSLLTCDRQESYFDQTLDNLKRAGLTKAPEVVKFNILSYPGISSKAASVLAFEEAAKTPADFVMFLEDDIDVIDNFFHATAAWLADVAHTGHRFFPLCAAYEEVLKSKLFWEYPLEKFYGTQAFVIPSADVPGVVEKLNRTPDRYPNSFDLALAEVLDMKSCLTPAPSFVQHIGEHSAIHPGRFHTYQSWPGPNWSYVPLDYRSQV